MTLNAAFEYPIVCSGRTCRGHDQHVVGVARLRDGEPLKYRLSDDLRGRSFGEFGA